jgi:hypothetical protein
MTMEKSTLTRREGRSRLAYRIAGVATICVTLIALVLEMDRGSAAGLRGLEFIGLQAFGAAAGHLFGWSTNYGRAGQAVQAAVGVTILAIALAAEWLTRGYPAGTAALLYMSGVLAIALWHWHRWNGPQT